MERVRWVVEMDRDPGISKQETELYGMSAL